MVSRVLGWSDKTSDLMKRLLLLIIILFPFLNSHAQDATSFNEFYGESHALLIGSSDYQTEWPRLPGVRNDLPAVKAPLELHGSEVDLGMDYSKVKMDSAYSAFIAAYGDQASNRLLFYYAGHGETVRTSYGESLSYLVPVDAPGSEDDIGTFQGSAMEMTQVEIYAKRIQSKHALFLFDACFSGSIFGQSRSLNEAINYQLTQPVRQFITSGDADESVPDESVFRKEFVSALNSPAADENKDGFLTGSELGTYLQDQVMEKTNGNQHPQYGKIRNPALDKGDFFFDLNLHAPKFASQSPFQPKVGEVAALKRYDLLT